MTSRRKARAARVTIVATLCCLGGALHTVNPAFAQPRTPVPLAASPSSSLVAYTARVAVVVEDRERAEMRIADVARRAGGALRRASAEMIVVTVPAEKLPEALREIDQVGDVDRPAAEAEDLSERVIDLQAQVRSAHAAIVRIDSVSSKPGSVSDRLKLEQERARLTNLIGTLESEIRALESRTREAVVYVTIQAPPPPAQQPINFQLPIRWLSKLGLGHLQNPPVRWRPAKTMLDGVGGLSFGKVSDSEAAGGMTATTWLGGSMRATFAGRRSATGYGFGYDLGLGGGFGSGLLWEVRMMTGFGLAFSNRARFGMLIGLGGDGVSGGGIPAGMHVPAELNLGIDLGSSVRFVAYSRPSKVFFAQARKRGSETIGIADEWTNGGWFVFGERRSYSRESSGFQIGMRWQQARHTEIYTIQIGYGTTLLEGFPIDE